MLDVAESQIAGAPRVTAYSHSPDRHAAEPAEGRARRRAWESKWTSMVVANRGQSVYIP